MTKFRIGHKQGIRACLCSRTISFIQIEQKKTHIAPPNLLVVFLRFCLFVCLAFFVYGMCSKKWNYTIGRNNENNKNIFNERRRSLIDTLEIMDADFKDEFLQLSVVPWSWGTAHGLGVTGG